MRAFHMASAALPLLFTFGGAASADTLVLPTDAPQVAQGTVIIAPTAPPPVRQEDPPPPPTTTTTMVQVWESGHWVWNGSTWEWAHGQYVVRPSTVSTTATWQ